MSNNLKTYKDIDHLLIAISNQQSAAGRMVHGTVRFGTQRN